MICPSCSKENANHFMFCLGCGAMLQRPPVGEPMAASPPPAPGNPYAASVRCSACGGGRTLQGVVGPAMGARVMAAGRPVDVPVASASVCIDCGHLALAIADDARRYLVGLFGG
jgi:hypothetical protein